MISSMIAVASYEARATCAVTPGTSDPSAELVTHLPSTCSPDEREAHALAGEAVIDAIAQGRRVDLVGVVIRGDLVFDRLPVEPAEGSNEVEGGQRAVHAALSIRDSDVRGVLRHRSSENVLRFEGPVDFQGSRFREGVDLSRSVFQQKVELSGAIFEKEAHFVRGRFIGETACRETKFGPSTRFHQSTFQGQLDCTGTLFDGMAEFLEVTFERPVTFERSRFGQGTGFSGSHFKSRVDFGEAIFSRETFFGFTVFENEVLFAGAQFLGAADFSSAEFKRPDDLGKARFDQPPILAQTKRLASEQSDGLLQTREGQYVLTLVFLVVAALLVAYLIKVK
ncbi:MAG: pentapeptide repeat-containing protein [Nitrospira sp.]|nr:pentapeptide repeat-containing protein [Nitrospira sp.]MDH4245376.1 pentapeptide repeat-containing protein [Nitrospira sp.]MDH4357787.1 pentapeptide repeat-containing protein [Nitrospira sp.]MDH5320050.1 pentapeptide repeat-containing protein [Nitrospira sp.]